MNNGPSPARPRANGHPGIPGTRLRRGERRSGASFAPAIVVTTLLAACSTPSVVTTEPNVPPANYRADILAYLRNYLNDPTGVRDAAISEPQLRAVAGTQRYVACLRFNAKDSTGKYEGTRERLVFFLAGQFDTMRPARGEQCAGVTWLPFPELEKLRR